MSTLSALLSAGICLLPAGGCAKKASKPPAHDTALILSQAQFIRETTPDGKGKSAPGPAKLVFLYPEGENWTTEVVEDPDGNVFHKAMAFDLPGQAPGILTIAAHKTPNPATLKVWRRTADGWEGELLWSQEFGGKFNRFRDVEIDDVTGDGKADIVVATHDQGVVAVLESQAGSWMPTVIDEKPDTFVHEIEIGDVDGDGQNEIFATPSAPNKADGTPQPGWVVMYKFDGESFNRTEIEHWDARHVKEVLVADVRGTGRPYLYTVLEATLGKYNMPAEGEQVEIREYSFGESENPPGGTLIATLPDVQCRFLNAGDVDGDGQPELIASGFKSGLWMIKPGQPEWQLTLIDGKPGGYEHATVLADVDGDGAQEIYVASDKTGQLYRYRWNGNDFDRADLYVITDQHITFGLAVCQDARCLAVQ